MERRYPACCTLSKVDPQPSCPCRLHQNQVQWVLGEVQCSNPNCCTANLSWLMPSLDLRTRIKCLSQPCRPPPVRTKLVVCRILLGWCLPLPLSGRGSELGDCFGNHGMWKSLNQEECAVQRQNKEQPLLQQKAQLCNPKDGMQVEPAATVNLIKIKETQALTKMPPGECLQ